MNRCLIWSNTCLIWIKLRKLHPPPIPMPQVTTTEPHVYSCYSPPSSIPYSPYPNDHDLYLFAQMFGSYGKWPPTPYPYVTRFPTNCLGSTTNPQCLTPPTTLHTILPAPTKPAAPLQTNEELLAKLLPVIQVLLFGYNICYFCSK